MLHLLVSCPCFCKSVAQKCHVGICFGSHSCTAVSPHRDKTFREDGRGFCEKWSCHNGQLGGHSPPRASCHDALEICGPAPVGSEPLAICNSIRADQAWLGLAEPVTGSHSLPVCPQVLSNPYGKHEVWIFLFSFSFLTVTNEDQLKI